MDNVELPQTFKQLHFLKLDSKSTENSQTFKYDLKNHFNVVVAHIHGKVVIEGDPEDGNNYIELIATEHPKNGAKAKNDNHPVNIFHLIIRKSPDSEIDLSDEFDAATTLTTVLNCDLLSDKGQILGRINVLKDTRSSTYSYDALERNNGDGGGNSLFQFSSKEDNENKWHVFINSVPPPSTSAESSSSPDTTATDSSTIIARVDLEDDKISLCMTPELNPLAKFRLISIMLLMEVVENRQKHQ